MGRFYANYQPSSLTSIYLCNLITVPGGICPTTPYMQGLGPGASLEKYNQVLI